MYRCFNIKRFLKLVICDLIVILFIAVIISFNKDRWFAFDNNPDNPIFLPVIMYHIISENPSKLGDYVVSPQTIENDFRYLKENRYEAVLVEDLLSYINDDSPLPEKPVVITFDDGYYNNMLYLLPLLEKYDMKSIISIVGSYTERDSNNNEQPNVNYSYLTWDDVSALNKTGLIEIGNHTYDLHTTDFRKGSCILSGESEEQYSKIFKSNVGLLQSELFMNSGVVPITFTYPYGFDCEESVPILKELGFKATFTCRERPNYISKDENSLYGLNRYNRPNGMTTEEFMSRLLTEK